MTHRPLPGSFAYEPLGTPGELAPGLPLRTAAPRPARRWSYRALSRIGFGLAGFHSAASVTAAVLIYAH